MSEPVISIITPVYNAEKYIGECIESVLVQNGPAFEHILIDGASTDGTLAIIRAYAETHPHIRCLSEPDSGQSAAMNKGVALARGEIIGVLNADDTYAEGVFKLVWEALSDCPEPGIVFGVCRVVNAAGERQYYNVPLRFTVFELLHYWKVGRAYNTLSFFYHRSLHDRVGLFDENDHYSMDYDFQLRAARVWHHRYIREVFGDFRLIEGTKTMQDLAAGTSEARKHAIYKKYAPTVSFADRLRLGASYLHHRYKERSWLQGSIKDRILNRDRIP